MKHYVITIMNNPESVSVANRCIRSGKEYGIQIQPFKAVTPADNPKEMLEQKGIETKYFDEVYSRTDNCMAAFLSHHSLWEKSVAINEEITIFEHDAVVTSQIPESIYYETIINLGYPSYGKYNTQQHEGVYPLFSKKYLPGAHAYRVNPRGAEALIHLAKTHAGPTDVFININSIPSVREIYPWPVVADDSFSTIQQTQGCLAKHSYRKNPNDYRLI